MEEAGKWGSHLVLEQERALFAYFRHHYAHFFPAPRNVLMYMLAVLLKVELGNPPLSLAQVVT